MWAGPFCTSQLARLGAEVIRIETAKHPCVGRTFVPQADGKVGLNRGGSFNEKNHNKLSVQLNLEKPESGGNRPSTGAPLRYRGGELRPRRDRSVGRRIRNVYARPGPT